MVWCVNSLSINLFKSVRERQGQIDSKRPEVRVERAGEGQTLFPGTPTTSMTWALHLDKSCRPRRARSKSSRYSSSDFWLSSPEPVTTWGTSTITFTANEPGTFPLYFTDPPKNTAREVLLIIPLDWKTEAQTSPWLVTWHANDGGFKLRWYDARAPLTMTPVNCGAVAFQTFGSVIYSRKCILYTDWGIQYSHEITFSTKKLCAEYLRPPLIAQCFIPKS